MAKNTMNTYEPKQTVANTKLIKRAPSSASGSSSIKKASGGKKAPTSGNTITGKARNTMSSGSTKKAPTSAVYRSSSPATPTKIGPHSGKSTVTPLKTRKKY